MPRTLTTFTDLMRQRTWSRIIPLLEVTLYRDRFADATRVSQTIRLADQDRRNVLGQDWLGAIGRWGAVAGGVARGSAFDVQVNNQLPLWNGLRFTDLLRFGLNQVGTFDAAFWDAKLYLLFEGGGSGDELYWTRLVLEEASSITEEAVELRFSGAELFLDTQDLSNLTPGSIIAVQAVASVGQGITGANPSVGVGLTLAGSFRFLLAGLLYDNPAGGNSTGVTLTPGALPLTKIGTIDAPTSTARVELWALVAPPTGAVTVTAGFNEPTPACHKAMGVLQFVNVHQTVPYRGVTPNAAFSSAPSSLPTSERGDLAVDAVGFYFEVATLPDLLVGADQTQRVNRTDVGNPGGSGDFIRLGMSTQLGAVGSTVLDWAIQAAGGGPAIRNWGALGLSLVPAG